MKKALRFGRGIFLKDKNNFCSCGYCFSKGDVLLCYSSKESKGDIGVPYGGTHVGNLCDIGTVTIRKIKQEKGIIKVSYL